MNFFSKLEYFLFYSTSLLGWVIRGLLFPFSILYCLAALINFFRTRQRVEGVKIISIGNIVVGGSGKTPITITLANYLKDKYKIGIVLRGVNREGKGVEKVSGIDPERFGEEAVELFLETGVPVVVGKDRLKGIEILKKEGIEVILMDDGFHKPIEKFEIVIDKKLPVPLCLPAGGYRLPRFLLKRADLILEEGINFWRRVTPIEGDILVTAISDPSRLLKWVNVKETLFFPDHHHFKWEELAHLQNKVIVTTRKDFVKLRRFPLTLKVIPLSIELAPDVLKKVEEYLINSSPTS